MTTLDAILLCKMFSEKQVKLIWVLTEIFRRTPASASGVKCVTQLTTSSHVNITKRSKVIGYSVAETTISAEVNLSGGHLEAPVRVEHRHLFQMTFLAPIRVPPSRHYLLRKCGFQMPYALRSPSWEECRNRTHQREQRRRC